VDRELPFEYWGRDEILFVDLLARGGDTKCHPPTAVRF
jgi:hypothetical protein